MYGGNSAARIPGKGSQMKSLIVHYRNKFPGSAVKASDSSFDVYSSEGSHLVSLCKNGAGQWVDQSESLGCESKHDLSPIPRDCRVWKLNRDGMIVKDDQAEARAKVAAEAASKHGGKIPSIAELYLAKNPGADLRSLSGKENYADLA